jgi:hypothetical protein
VNAEVNLTLKGESHVVIVVASPSAGLLRSKQEDYAHDQQIQRDIDTEIF